MATNNEDTVYNKPGTDNSEDTQLIENQAETTTEKKGKNSWKQITIGGMTGILLGASGVFLGGSSSVINDSNAPGQAGGPAQSSNESGTPVSADSHVAVDGLPIATVSDDMTFSEAFAAARQEVGAGGVFEWNGGVYGTYYADEWKAMTPEQQAEFGNRLSYGHTDTEASVTEESVTEEPQIVEVTTHDEHDVQIVGVENATFEDGSVAIIEQVTMDGSDVYFVDIDTVGNSMETMHPDDNLYADLPDYTNDADLSCLI